ncbi:MAG: hypothetical protein QG652_826, partial [Pseudomonadota bacterium]|nr:hypothetical protein [Pseudomonadota bacterium]
MKLKNLVIAAAAITILSQGTALQAATVIGTYSMEATATLTGGQGLAYNGSSWYYGFGSSWQTNTGTAWQSSTAPSDLNDISAASFLADTSSAGSLNLGFGFDGTHAVNGSGSDLVFFFLWDQSANTANVSINGVTRELSFHNVYN